MKTIETLTGKFEVEIYHAYGISRGYGHKKIVVEINYNGNYRTFEHTTPNMPAYDYVLDMLDDGEDINEALYDIIKDDIFDEVSEWIEEVIKEEKEA